MAELDVDALARELVSWVEVCGGGWDAPWWLIDLARVLVRGDGGSVRAGVGVPVRHGKTTLLMVACAWWLRRNPRLRIVYMTYSILRASEIGRDIRDLCRRMGVRPSKDHDTIANWRNDEGGGVSVMSAQQSKLGADVDILLVDDPYEGPAEADKLEVRELVDSVISFYTMRLSPGGSAILVMSPWRPDDAIGVRLERKAEKWEHVHSQALSVVDGVEVALAPSIRSVEWLRQMRAVLAEQDPTERLWWAQWQCEPIAVNGDDDFVMPVRYAELPAWPGFIDGIGIDMSYSKAKTADWFAIVAVRMQFGQLFVRHVDRFKANEGMAENKIRTAWEQFGHCQIYSYMSGPEVGIAHYLASRGIHVNVLPARFNKRIRARKTINRAKAKDLLIPEFSSWGAGFTRRLLAWRGAESDEDDEIDALVSVHDGIYGNAGSFVATTLGKPRM